MTPSVVMKLIPLLDDKTASIIRESLRRELQGDTSLITVTDRLQTTMDAEKIMVLDAGRIVEFDRPKELLKLKEGKLRALVEESATEMCSMRGPMFM
ncbi:hypothetical protein FB451DRAFT_1400520 [Mycena latifolia]|nr:hypothetical protein FB451DRAFT_1400520 [Mycena latifolia]